MTTMRPLNYLIDHPQERLMQLLVSGIICWALISAPILAVELPSGFADELIAAHFNTPVALTPLPDGKIIVLEQYNGKVYLLNSKNPPTRALIYTFTDVNSAGGNERGLLGVAADPAFAENGFLYFYYTAKGNHCQITRLTFDHKNSPAKSIDPDSRLVILSDIPDNAWNHNGGTLRFGPDGMLYVSIGDDASSCIAQSIADMRGSILRLDVRLSEKEITELKSGDKTVLTPEDNPFAEYLEANTKLIYVSGLRNPFRFDIDPQSGALYIADVGLLDFEEIDFVPYASGGGQNFGWPFYEGPARRAQPGCKIDSEEKYFQPVANYDRTGFMASVISLCVYRPNNPPGEFTWPEDYFGNYLYTDYFAGFVRRLKASNNQWWNNPDSTANSLNWATDLKSVPDAFVGADGALYYLRQFDDNFSPKSGQLRRIIYQKVIPSE